MARNTLVRGRNLFSRDVEEGGGGGEKEYTPPATQEEFDRIVQERLARATSKYADYDTWKAKGEQFDLLANESLTDKERRERELREEAFNEAMSKAVPIAVRQAFRAEAKGVLSAEQVESLLEDLDLNRYANDDGSPDEEKIAKKVSAFAPGGQGGNGRNGTGPGFGQGRDYQQSTPKRGEAGLAEAQRRFGKDAVPAGKS